MHQKDTFLSSLIMYYLPVWMFHHWHFICTSALISVIRQQRSYLFFFIIAPKRHIFAFTNNVLFACLNVSSLTFYLHFYIDFSNKVERQLIEAATHRNGNSWNALMRSLSSKNIYVTQLIERMATHRTPLRGGNSLNLL